MIYIRTFIQYFSIFCLVFTFLINSIYLVQIFLSIFEFQKSSNRKKRLEHKLLEHSSDMIPTSVLVPAYNEEKTIIDNVNYLLKLDYPEFEVIVVNDGSTDGTHDLLMNNFDFIPISYPIKISIETKKIISLYRSKTHSNLIYALKENGGKADSLNLGINISNYPLIATIDADSMLERDALIKMQMEFLEEPDTIAVGGTIRIINDTKIENGTVKSQNLPKSLLAKFQLLEYFRSFFGSRVSWNAYNAVLIVSGAFGGFLKDAVIKCGGYNADTIGEDMEMIVKLHHYNLKNNNKYKITYILDSICWTQAPESIKDFHIQRRRWQIGLINTLLNHNKMTLRPKYKYVGMLAMPYYWIFDVLGPVVEGLGYIIIPIAYLFGELSLSFFLAYLIVAILMGVALSIGGIVLDQYGNKSLMSTRNAAKLILLSFVESFGFRQLTTIIRIDGILKYRKLGKTWGVIKRKSFD